MRYAIPIPGRTLVAAVAVFVAILAMFAGLTQAYLGDGTNLGGSISSQSGGMSAPLPVNAIYSFETSTWSVIWLDRPWWTINDGTGIDLFD